MSLTLANPTVRAYALYCNYTPEAVLNALQTIGLQAHIGKSGADTTLDAPAVFIGTGEEGCYNALARIAFQRPAAVVLINPTANLPLLPDKLPLLAVSDEMLPASILGHDSLSILRISPYNAGQAIAAWLDAILPKIARPEAHSYTVTVALDGTGLTTKVQTPVHGWIADEPVAEGGNDNGPSPYEHLLAALGTCTAMTLRLYANVKKWNVSQIHVELTHEKRTNDANAKYDYIHRSIRLIGDLDVEQKQRMLEIANRCPVHRTLSEKPQIESSLAE